MPDLSHSAPASDQENVVVLPRPKQGSGSRMYANFRSAIASIRIYRRYTVLAIFAIFVGALLVMVTDILIQSANTYRYAQTLTLLFIIVGGISFVASGFIMLSILLVVGTERAREFSMRLVIGAHRRDIRNQILFETIILSGIGGVLGSISGFGLGFLLTLWLHRPFSVNPDMLLLMVGVSVVPGIACGLYPALRASRLDTERVGSSL